MKEQLIKLAKEKGFVSITGLRNTEIIVRNEMFYCLWMCELQKWLRINHKVHLRIDVSIIDNWYFDLFNLNDKRNCEFPEYYNPDDYKTYELVLEAGLLEALKLIEV